MLFPLLLVAAWAFCEFYDHVPKRSWVYRQTHTLALIDVTAKLEIDGQPVAFTRTIRCIKQPYVPYATPPEAMNVFDAVGGIVNGRTFVMNLPRVCDPIFNASRNAAFQKRATGHASHSVSPDQDAFHLAPVSYSTGELTIPVIYEPVGGYLPDHINAYISRAGLLRGDHGVRFVDLIIAQSSKTFLMFDGDEFDTLRGKGTSYTSEKTWYRVYPIIEFPFEYWQSARTLQERVDTCQRPCVISNHYGLLRPTNHYYSFPDLILTSIFSKERVVPPEREMDMYSTVYKEGILRVDENNAGLLVYRPNVPDSIFIYEFKDDVARDIKPESIYVSKDNRVFYVQYRSGFIVGR